MSYDNLYRNELWRRVRAAVLDRDDHRCQIRGPHCKGRATEVDHIIPVADGGAVYDPANLRASCKTCNIARANRQKSRDGWRRANTHIVLVVGPPGACEPMSDYVTDHAGPHDLIIDYRALAQALGQSHETIVKVRGHLLTQLRRGESEAPRAWIVSTNPAAESMFPHHEVVTVDPGEDAAHAGFRDSWTGRDDAVVDEWYQTRTVASTGLREW